MCITMFIKNQFRIKFADSIGSISTVIIVFSLCVGKKYNQFYVFGCGGERFSRINIGVDLLYIKWFMHYLYMGWMRDCSKGVYLVAIIACPVK